MHYRVAYIYSIWWVSTKRQLPNKAHHMTLVPSCPRSSFAAEKGRYVFFWYFTIIKYTRNCLNNILFICLYHKSINSWPPKEMIVIWQDWIASVECCTVELSFLQMQLFFFIVYVRLGEMRSDFLLIISPYKKRVIW